MKDGSRLYEWTKKWFFEEELPGRFGSLENLVQQHKNARASQENHNQTSFRIVYDGDRILNEFSKKMLVAADKYPKESVDVNSYDDFRCNYISRIKNMPNGDDVTGMYNHKSGEMQLTHAELKNYHIRPDGTEVNSWDYVNGLPEDFLHPEGKIDSHNVGTGTKALQLTTGEFPELGAVILKTSQYMLGPKVVLMKNGKVAKESFAKYEDGSVKIMERTYRKDGTRAEYCIDKMKMPAAPVKDCLPSYDMYPVGAQPYSMAV